MSSLDLQSEKKLVMQGQRSPASSQSNYEIELVRTWNFKYGVFHQKRLSAILCHVQQAIVDQANLGANQSQQIPIIVSHINFPSLKILNLQTNHIKNIEILQFLKVNQLKQLNLKNNQITNLRVLKKLKWLNIQTLIFDKNYFVDMHSVTQSQFISLEDFHLESSNDQKISHNLNILAKLNSVQLKSLTCSSKKRIVDTLAIKQLKEKYKKQIQPQQPQVNNLDEPGNINLASELVVIQRKRYV